MKRPKSFFIFNHQHWWIPFETNLSEKKKIYCWKEYITGKVYFEDVNQILEFKHQSFEETENGYIFEITFKNNNRLIFQKNITNNIETFIIQFYNAKTENHEELIIDLYNPNIKRGWWNHLDLF